MNITMKKIYYTILTILMFSFSTSCSDYLNVSSPSNVDEDFVFSDPSEAYKVLMGCYDIFRSTNNGFMYDLLVVGSDSECHPEAYTAQTRHIPEGLYASEIPINNYEKMWASYYKMANRLAIMISQIEAKSEFRTAVEKGEITEWTQLYGEAVVLRSIAYLELVKFYGDVPFFEGPIYTENQVEGSGLTSRFVIYDKLLESLKKVEPYMYRLGEKGLTAERITRNFAQAYIGNVALFAGGYSLCRTNFDYGDVIFEQKGIEKWSAKYVRRADYKKYYEVAKQYLSDCITSPGTAYLIVNDERGYGNAFQRNFQYQLDLEVSPESLYEIGETQGNTTERPYAFGRPSDGGNSNAYPCKAYGQSRMYASFYYGDFDNADLRKDVTVTVSANSGSCSEKMIRFVPGSRSNGGLANNKWDDSRMKEPYIKSSRNSGVNTAYMRMADAILMLAEISAELGDEGTAKSQLSKVRSRAFRSEDQSEKVVAYINNLSGQALKDAILQERKLEFAGEGVRRYDLIRTGRFPEAIKALRDKQKAMIAGLKADGYYTFENGNTISNYIWIRKVNASEYGLDHMLTKTCNVSKEDSKYPVLFPGWRGNYDGWSNFSNAVGKRNIAIQGLFNYIDPNGAEASALEAQGYVKTRWALEMVYGIVDEDVKDAGGKLVLDANGDPVRKIVSMTEIDQYTNDIFKGYTDDYYKQGVPPRYLVAIPSEPILRSKGLITNGYGFAQN